MAIGGGDYYPRPASYLGSAAGPVARARIVLGQRVGQHVGDEFEPNGRVFHEL
jgi:hypothetical protein